MNVLTRTAVAAAALLMLAAAPAAHGAEARFQVSIKGTFTSEGNATSTCHPPTSLEPVQVNVTSHDEITFTSANPGSVSVRELRGSEPTVAILKFMRVKVVQRRSNTLTPSVSCPNKVDPSRCGTRKRTVYMGVYGGLTRNAFYYQIANRTGPQFPNDPFDSTLCGAFSPQVLWWKLNNTKNAGAVSKSKLFDEGVKRIEAKGRFRQATNTLDYTITLVRQ